MNGKLPPSLSSRECSPESRRKGDSPGTPHRFQLFVPEIPRHPLSSLQAPEAKEQSQVREKCSISLEGKTDTPQSVETFRFTEAVSTSYIREQSLSSNNKYIMF